MRSTIEGAMPWRVGIGRVRPEAAGPVNAALRDFRLGGSGSDSSCSLPSSSSPPSSSGATAAAAALAFASAFFLSCSLTRSDICFLSAPPPLGADAAVGVA